jgi:prepilin-type N-terminal cleavage/methylation domain-containing protein
MATPMTSSRRNSSRKTGFTLVEILAVVVILGLAAAVILPRVGNHANLRASSMTRVIMADLAYVQSRAVTTQRPHYVRFDLVNNRYEVLDRLTASGEQIIAHPVDKAPFVVPLGGARTDPLRDVVLDAVTFDGRPVLKFDELGSPHSFDPDTFTSTPLAAGSVRVKSHEFTMTITVEPYSGELKAN